MYEAEHRRNATNTQNENCAGGQPLSTGSDGALELPRAHDVRLEATDCAEKESKDKPKMKRNTDRNVMTVQRN